MFWGMFRKGRMGPGLFFDLEKGESINSMVYRGQILMGPLNNFGKSLLEMLEWPPNSSDLNPIENIWSYIKDIIARDYVQVSSAEEMKRIVCNMREQFKDREWDKLLESIPHRMEVVIVAKGGSTGY